MKKIIFLFLFVLGLSLYMLHTNGFSLTVKEGDKTYIVDRSGERWDITQAISIGFKPERFQFGLGRNAFFPLSDMYLSEGSDEVPDHLRVLAVEDKNDAREYSISKLSGHEIANSSIGGNPIAVGY
jgi:hypothetical protein